LAEFLVAEGGQATGRSSPSVGERQGSETLPAPGHLYLQEGVWHLIAAYDLNQDKIYGHIKMKKDGSIY
jgi:hypothetical protein